MGKNEKVFVVVDVKLKKEEITQVALQLGAEFIGYAPVSRWHANGDLPEEFYPDYVCPLTKTVIVMGVPVWLPILDAAPSEWGREQYNITNALLDQVAYRLTAFLNRNGYASVNVSRDGYGSADILLEQPVAIFSHVWAGYYAGLGTIGWNHTLLTKKYGPRIRLVSVLTSMQIDGTPILDDNLCTKCKLCQKICPAHVFEEKNNERFSKMNKFSCASNGKKLRQSFINPCGSCIKVCPIGADRELFQRKNVQLYFNQPLNNQQKLDNQLMNSWKHIRKYGGKNIQD